MSVIANYFAKSGNIDVHLCVYGISKNQFYTLHKNVQIHIPDFDFNNERRFINTLKTMKFLRHKVRSLKPDALLSFGEYWNSFVLLSLYGLSYPVFISDRCQPDKSLGRLHDILRKVLYPKAAGIIFQTEAARSIYSRIVRHKNNAVIGNPIQEIALTAGTHRENIVLSLGRLIPSKHHDMLIDIFLASYQPGWKLIIVGGDVAKGVMLNQLTAKIARLKAENKIELTGNISSVETYYQRSRIFAFTSASEGFPNVIGEAMSAGLPVVAFDCVAGPSEMIENEKDGFLIPLFDQQLFSEKLKLLMKNESLREQMGAHARASIKRFAPEIIGQKYEQFIFQEKSLI
ncbi:glycosyltransferase family 4 protein [Lentimicrobium sp.]